MSAEIGRPFIPLPQDRLSKLPAAAQPVVGLFSSDEVQYHCTHPQDRLNKLAKLVRLPPPAAKAAAARLPRLLALEPKVAKARLAALCELLRVDDGRAAALAGQQPGLLLHAPDTLK